MGHIVEKISDLPVKALINAHYFVLENKAVYIYLGVPGCPKERQWLEYYELHFPAQELCTLIEELKEENRKLKAVNAALSLREPTRNEDQGCKDCPQLAPGPTEPCVKKSCPIKATGYDTCPTPCPNPYCDDAIIASIASTVPGANPHVDYLCDIAPRCIKQLEEENSD